MSRVCVHPTGVCTAACPNRPVCTMQRRSILQYFVATHPQRGVYVDAVASDIALRRAEELSDISDGSTNRGIGFRPGAVRINKGMM